MQESAQCVCVCVCVRACVCACMRVCVCVHAYARRPLCGCPKNPLVLSGVRVGLGQTYSEISESLNPIHNEAKRYP